MQITLIDTFKHNYNSRQEKVMKPDASLRVVTFSPLVKEEAIIVYSKVAEKIIEGLRFIEAIYYDPKSNSTVLVYFLPELKYCFVFEEKRTYLSLFESIIETKSPEWVLLDTNVCNPHIRNLEMKGEYFPVITITSLINKEK